MGGSIDIDSDIDPDGILNDETLDENMHYRYVRNNQARVSKMLARGYKVVSRSEDGVETLYQSGDDGADTIIHGDRVLMALPKEKKERRDKRKQQINDLRLKGPAERFRTEAAKQNVEVVTRETKNEPKD